MSCPTVSEVLLELLTSGAIKKEDAAQYLSNYEYFEDQRSRIEVDCNGLWVASLNGQLYTADSLEELQRLIDGKPNANTEYIEQG
jgi:hypothetical protein